MDCRRIEVTKDRKSYEGGYLFRIKASSFDEFMNSFIRIVPLYTMERLNYFSLFKSTKKEDSCVNWRVLCCLLRVAHVLGEEEIAKKLIEFLQTPNAYSFNVLSNLTTVFEEMSEVVSREEFTTIVNGLLENTLKEVKELSCNLNIVYTKWPGLIASLVQVIPHSNPTLLELLDVLAIHEKRYKSMSIGEQMRFYGLQQKEIPP